MDFTFGKYLNSLCVRWLIHQMNFNKIKFLVLGYIILYLFFKFSHLKNNTDPVFTLFYCSLFKNIKNKKGN